MGNEFWVNMALSVLFGVLQEKAFLKKYEKAFRKLHTYIGLAYGWNDALTSSEFPKSQKDA